jgi:hypothetical protein
MPNRRRLLLAATVATPVLFEVGSRVATTIADDIARAKEGERIDWLVFSPTVGWERKPGFKGVAGLAEREFDAAGYFTADSKAVAGDGNQKRVVFVGGSCTFGFGAQTRDSFAKVVERRLPGVATINLSAMGYSSYQGNLVAASTTAAPRRTQAERTAREPSVAFMKTRRSSTAQERRRPSRVSMSTARCAASRVV